MFVDLPNCIHRYLETIENPLVRDYVALAANKCIVDGQFAPHSKVVERVVKPIHYKEYRLAMEGLEIWEKKKHVSKSWYEQHKAAYDAYNTKPRNTTFKLKPEFERMRGRIRMLVDSEVHENPEKQGVKNIDGNGSTWYHLSDEFVCRLQAAFDWFALKHAGSEGDTEQILQLVRMFLDNVVIPEVSSDQINEWCEYDESRFEENLQTYQRICDLGAGYHGGLSGARCHFDFGGRVYHPLTNLKKEIRRLLTTRYGKRIREVDLHATFPCILTAAWASQREKQVLIPMLKSGQFYHQMAQLLGIPDVSRVKQCFQREVVFSWRPSYSDIWNKFKMYFPDLAYMISCVRDRSEDVVCRRKKRDARKRPFICTTRQGQRDLSRFLSRAESEIFLKGAMLDLFREHGVVSLPIHDCLCVEDGQELKAKSVIENQCRNLLGFVPYVKVV